MAGSKSSRPASAIATTVSGEVTNANVDFRPSLRCGKLRLYEVTIVLACPRLMSSRCHWPMHGPHDVGEHDGAELLEVGEQAVALRWWRAPARSRA